MLRTPTLVTLVLTSTLLVACGRNGEGDTAERVVPRETGERQTATGCLSMNPESRLYVLTAAPSPVVGTTGGVVGGVAGEAPTSITYQLAGGEGLENHIGHEVEVTGWVDQDAAQTAATSLEREDTPRNTTQDEAKVETTTEARIRVVPMQVESFRMVSSGCTSGEERPEVPNPS